MTVDQTHVISIRFSSPCPGNGLDEHLSLLPKCPTAFRLVAHQGQKDTEAGFPPDGPPLLEIGEREWAGPGAAVLQSASGAGSFSLRERSGLQRGDFTLKWISEALAALSSLKQCGEAAAS